MMLICIYHLLKIEITWYTMKMVKRCILGVLFTKIKQNTKISKGGITLEIEIKDGQMLINLLLLIYRIICCGNQNMGFASSMNWFSLRSG